MSSAVGICNLALGHIGDEATVSSISPPESTVQAEQCAKFYPIARDQLLEMGWTFNTKRATLALLEEDPTPSWLYSYAAPASYLKILAVVMPGATDDTDTEDFVVETADDGSKVIYTNVEDAETVYLAKVTDTTKWTPNFVTAASWLLASFIAGPIIRGRAGVAMAKFARETAGKQIKIAHALDANESQQSNLYKDYVPSSIKARA